MYHHNQIRQVELLPGAFVNQHSLLPTVLKKKNGIVNIVTEDKVSVGDTVQDWPYTKDLEVVEVLETRKARGDWANTSYKKAPVFSQIKIA